MIIKIDNKTFYASDCGQGVDLSKNTLVFLHGSGLSHIVWSLSEQYFSNKNFNVLSIDLPGHGNSDGPCLESIEEIADWLEKVFNKLKTNQNKSVLVTTGIFPPDIGGPATYSKLLLDELPKHGLDISVLSFGEVRHLPKIIRHISYFFKVLRRGKGVDIIYAQDPVSVGLPSVVASKILRKKFLLKVVGDYAWEQYMQKSEIPACRQARRNPKIILL